MSSASTKHLAAVLLRRWIDFVQRYPRRVIAVASALAVVSLVYTAMFLGFKTDRNDLVDQNHGFLEDWRRFEAEFGGESDIIVVVEGTDRNRMENAIEAVASGIRKERRLFEKLCYRIQVDELKAKGLFQLSLEDLREIEARIEPLKPLLAIGGWQGMTVDNVLHAIQFRVNCTEFSLPVDLQWREFLIGVTGALESLKTYAESGKYASPWHDFHPQGPRNAMVTAPEYFFSDNGHIAFLTVAPIARDSKSFTGFQEPVTRIRAIIDQTRASFPELSFGLTGLPVLEYDEMQAAAGASSWSTVLEIVGVSTLFFSTFRAFQHPLYALISLLISASVSLGWVTLTVGHLNILSVSFIVTLIGLGIDYGIMWLSRYEADRAGGATAEEANLETAESMGPGIFSGAITTALAFYATMFTNFLGLREMGWVAGSGIMFCLAGSFTVLPALLKLTGHRKIAVRRGRRDLNPAFPLLNQHAVPIAMASAVVVAFLATKAPYVAFDYNLLHLQAKGLPAVQWETKLIDETGTSAWYALSMANTPEQAADLKRRFEALGSVGRVVEIASLAPADQARKQPIIQRIHDCLRGLPPRQPAPLVASTQTLNLLGQVSKLLKSKQASNSADRGMLEKLRSVISSVHQTMERMNAEERQQLVTRFQELWKTDVLKQLQQLAAASNPNPVTFSDLPEALRSRYHGKTGKWLLQIFAKASVWDIEPLREFCTEVRSVDPHVTGKPISALNGVIQMTDGYKATSWLAAAVILLAVWIDLGGVLDTLLALIPLVIGCVMTAGIMVMTGIAFNPANLIALPLILGIGIDSGVHVLHDYHDHEGPYILNWRLARPLMLTSGTTVIGFASLLVAHHWGMVSIGLVLLIGVTSCATVALLFLPAILNILSRRRAIAEEPTIHEMPARVKSLAA